MSYAIAKDGDTLCVRATIKSREELEETIAALARQRSHFNSTVTAVEIGGMAEEKPSE